MSGRDGRPSHRRHQLFESAHGKQGRTGGPRKERGDGGSSTWEINRRAARRAKTPSVSAPSSAAALNHCQHPVSYYCTRTFPCVTKVLSVLNTVYFTRIVRDQKMAASKSFAFEEREFTEASNAQLAPGSVPDFEAFGAIDLGAVSPAIGVVQGKAAYRPMSKGHEYVFDEEEKQRTFGEHLVFYTGAAYMSGIVAGTTLGVLEGAKKMKTLPNASTRLKATPWSTRAPSGRPRWGQTSGCWPCSFPSTNASSVTRATRTTRSTPSLGPPSLE